MDLMDCMDFMKRWRSVAAIAFLLFATALQAQDHTILFSTADPGVSRAITNWGLDTTWTSSDNMRRGLTFMGTNNVTIIRVGFLANSPLTNIDISPTQKATLQSMASVAAMASPTVVW